MFTARFALSRIKQTHFVFKELKLPRKPGDTKETEVSIKCIQYFCETPQDISVSDNC